MRILDRYLIRELLVSALFAVGALSLVLVFGQIFKKLFEYLIDHNTPVSFILTFVAYVLPASLTLTVPWGFLTAVLLVFGRLSASNELTALRAHGVSIGRVAQPAFFLAVALCGLCLWINLSVAPRSQQKLKDAFFKLATSNPAAVFTGDQVITDFPGRKIYVGKRTGETLENLHVFELNDDGQPIRVVHAKRGRLETNLAAKEILMRLQDIRYEQRSEQRPDDLHQIHDGITAGLLPFPVSLEKLYEKKQGRRRLESLSVHELRREMKTGIATGGKRGDARKPDRARSTAARTEWNRRFSYSLACLTFAFIGIPLGIGAQRQETSIGFALSLGVAFAYYLIILIVNTMRDKPGAHPELLIWLPNVIFLAVGVTLFWRLLRR